jgi:hypothetical protein
MLCSRSNIELISISSSWQVQGYCLANASQNFKEGVNFTNNLQQLFCTKVLFVAFL